MHWGHVDTPRLLAGKPLGVWSLGSRTDKAAMQPILRRPRLPSCLLAHLSVPWSTPFCPSPCPYFHIIIVISETTQEHLHSDITQGPLLLASEGVGG